jgi:hypothetical protein
MIRGIPMGFKALLVFTLIIGIAGIIYKIIMKKIDRWGAK